MIKSTTTPQVKEDNYPCLKQSLTNGQIVLFTERKTGTVVNTGESTNPIWYYSRSWNEDSFELYPYPVILENI